MKRILLSPIGSWGDILPFLWIGNILQEKGCEVTVISNPHFREAIEKQGFLWLPFGTEEEFQESISDPSIWHRRKGTKAVFHYMGLMAGLHCDIISKYLESGSMPLVISPATAFGVRMARTKHPFPLITVHLQPPAILSAHDFTHFGKGTGIVQKFPLPIKNMIMRLGKKYISSIVLKELLPACKERNIILPGDLFRDWWHDSNLVLNLFPSWFASPQPDWPQLTICVGFPTNHVSQSFPLSKNLQTFLREEEKPIVFTLGTAMRHGNSFFRTAWKVCKKNNLRAIFATRYPDQLPPNLPPTIQVERSLPFEEVLPQCAAIVHHGGIGTVAHAFAAGIPQLIMPMAHDQPDNANRIKTMGLGEVLYPSQFTPKLVEIKLKKLLTHREIKRRCVSVKEMIQSDSPKENLLTALASFLS